MTNDQKMLYSEAIDYLYSRLPVFHRIGPKALKPGLKNIVLLCEALGNPHLRFRSIHIAGTNGKGSTSHMLASVYQEAGYRVGLYTSPHLKSFTERIRINGTPIKEAEVAAFVEEHRSLIEEIEPSFFEVTVAMAFLYFAEQAVDLAIIEVGLGGRLDSTNIIIPEASVITNIGYDHMDVLGDTLSAIAAEKSGIIKPAIPVIISETTAETKPVFHQIADSQNAPVYWAEDWYEIKDEGVMNGLRKVLVKNRQGLGLNPIELTLDLIGGYQLKNVQAVLKTVNVLQSTFRVGVEDFRKGIASVVANTGLKGRFQVLGRKPLLIADIAHNQQGLTALFETIETIPHDQLRIIFGMVADKNVELVLSILPKNAQYYFCESDTPRSLRSTDLQKEANRFGLPGMIFTDVNRAVNQCIEFANVNDLVLVTGSNYLIAELNNL